MILMVLSVAGLATAQSMSISGTVTDYETGNPIEGAWVHAMHAGMAYTDSAGDYMLRPMRPGAYVVSAWAEGYESAVYPDTIYIEQGQTIEDIDFALVPLQSREFGAISGVVVDARTRLPIARARVHTMHRLEAFTNERGYYIIDSVPAGDYIVAAGALGYLPAVYPDTVTVVAGRTTENINFALVPDSGGREFGAISGMVVDARTRRPIARARVSTSNRLEAFTNERGLYIIESVPAGTHRVHAEALGYRPAVYPDTVVVVPGRTSEHIDFALMPDSGGGREFGAISGRVIDADTREPIARARVHTFHRREAFTNERGYYLLDSLPAGDYIVHASAMGYQGEVYPDTIIVVGGQTVENIDFALEPCQPRHGVISGVVTDDETGQLIRGALVKAQNEEVTRQVTQCCRGYVIGMLPPGKYWVSAVAPGYEPGAYGDSVEVLAGQVTDGIDFSLEPDGQGTGGIAGLVTNAETGDPIVGAYVVANGPSRGYSNTNPDGEYVIRGLIPGRYEVRAHVRGFEPSAPETVDVVEGQITEDVDFELVPLGGGQCGFIAGTVTDSATGDPIFHAHVFVRSMHGQGMAYTDSSGNYLLRIRPGSYLVRASARYHFPAVYPDTVTVADGDTVYDIDFALRGCPRLGAGIAGFVFDGYTQEDLAGVTVTAIGEQASHETVTDEHGEYVLEGLEPGDYRIEVSGRGYEDGMYPELLELEPDMVESFTTPWMYQLSGIEESPAPKRAADVLFEARPNLLTSSATVRWQVPMAGHVTVQVVDNTGRVVTVLHSGQQNAGQYSATWDGRDGAGRRVANGTYFYHLNAPGAFGIQKTVLLAK